MSWTDPGTIITIITSLGAGGAAQATVGWLKDRKRNISEIEKTDVETKLAYLNTVIERLDAEAKRSLAERDRLQEELDTERERSRKRIRELEDEIDVIRKFARETQYKCDELANKLKKFVDDIKE